MLRMKLPDLLRKELILKTKMENKFDKYGYNFVFCHQLINENYYEFVNLFFLKENENMTTNKQYKKQLSIIFDNLPIKKVIELFDFAQFLNEQYLKEKNSALNKNSLLIQQQSLRKIWDSSEEDVYEL